MGACLSTPDVQDGGAGGAKPRPAAPERQRSEFEADRNSSVPPIVKEGSAARTGSEGSRVGSFTLSATSRLRSTTRAALHTEFLSEVRALDRALHARAAHACRAARMRAQSCDAAHVTCWRCRSRAGPRHAVHAARLCEHGQTRPVSATCPRRGAHGGRPDRAGAWPRPAPRRPAAAQTPARRAAFAGRCRSRSRAQPPASHFPRRRRAALCAQTTQVHSLQQQLAVVNDYPLLGLQEAAELLGTQLGADLVA